MTKTLPGVQRKYKAVVYRIGGKVLRKYILKRILISIVILFFVGFIIYALMRCLPTSYIENMARQKSMQPGSKSYEEWMEQLTVTYHMDKDILPGYLSWIGEAVQGHFGDSWFYTVPVLENLKHIRAGISHKASDADNNKRYYRQNKVIRSV